MAGFLRIPSPPRLGQDAWVRNPLRRPSMAEVGRMLEAAIFISEPQARSAPNHHVTVAGPLSLR